MKKTIAMLLAVVMIMGMCMSLSACSSKKDYVGVWKKPGSTSGYMYIYKDGTGDHYGRLFTNDISHFNGFTWEIEDGYIVMTDSVGGSIHVTKYTLSGSNLLDSQGKILYTKHSSDTSVDLPIE